MSFGRYLRSGAHTSALALLFLAPLSGCRADHGGAESNSPVRPNILFVFADDHAAHAIGAYGSRLNATPNIDRLAEEGMLFRNAFVTNSICAPSRAVILTGKHSHLNGVYTNREHFDGEQLTFPKLLQEAGYQTAIVGKWHLKSEPTGFDYWEVLPGQGTYYNPDFLTAEGRIETRGYVTDIITDKVLGWLANARDPERPFMLMYQHKAPHRRWEPPFEHLETYDAIEIPEPTTLFDDYSGRASPAKTQEMTIAEHLYENDLKLTPPQQLDEEQLARWSAAYEPKNEAFRAASLSGDELVRWKYQRYLKDYLRVIASIDDNLGRVLDYLEESGLADNTVVIYSSDQGFFLGDHGWYDKRWMYEPSLRTPLIVRWPAVAGAGSEDIHLVQNLDFAATFLAMAGIETPADMQGQSLVPLLRGERPEDWRTGLYYQYYEYPAVHSVRRHYGVRTHRFKLIHYYEIDEWELFDLDRDPDELNSVYDDAEYSDTVDELKTMIARLRTYYEVPENDPVPYPDEESSP